jgi:hypothetical protein
VQEEAAVVARPGVVLGGRCRNTSGQDSRRPYRRLPAGSCRCSHLSSRWLYCPQSSHCISSHRDLAHACQPHPAQGNRRVPAVATRLAQAQAWAWGPQQRRYTAGPDWHHPCTNLLARSYTYSHLPSTRPCSPQKSRHTWPPRALPHAIPPHHALDNPLHRQVARSQRGLC